MGELVSYAGVRADHQRGTADCGQVHSKGGSLAWCPDASVNPPERHEWRACDAAPLTGIASFAAYLGTVESAVS